MSVLKNFNQLCEPILEQQVENILQIELLTKQRDNLLPLLMNGQVSVNYHLYSYHFFNSSYIEQILTL